MNHIFRSTKPTCLGNYQLGLIVAVAMIASTSFLESIEARQVSTDSSKSEQSATKSTQFLRLRKDKSQKPVAMQVAISRYVAENGGKPITVDLVAVVHIGEKEFYEKLNKAFKEYDAVLYELVAPEGTVIDQKSLKENSNPLRMMQSIPQQMLGLDSQLEIIDYKAKNFVHADLTPEEIAAKMAERGDTALTILLDTASDMIRQQNKAAQKASSSESSSMSNDLTSMLEMMGDPAKMKLAMAKQFVESGDLDLGLGKSLNQLLIKDRNEAAMKDFNKQVFVGNRKLAIFYGAAHMPDFEKRLKEDYDFKLKKQTWIDAWDLTKSKSKASDDPAELLLKMLKDIGGK